MNQCRQLLSGYLLFWLGVWALIGVLAIIFRPVLPVLELPIFAQAWVMWEGGSHLVSLEGDGRIIYPLYLWLIQGTWALFGVSDIWPRLLPLVFGFGCTLMILALARLLWPDREQLWVLSTTITIGVAGWIALIPLSGEISLTTLCLLVAFYGLLSNWQRGTWKGLILVGIGMGLGFMASGFLVILHVLSVAFLTPVWAPLLDWRGGEEKKKSLSLAGWWNWYGRLAVSVMISIFLILMWFIPLGMVTGFSSIVEFLHGSFLDLWINSEDRGWWSRTILLILLMLPWIIWPPAWRAIAGVWPLVKDSSGRFCLVWCLLSATFFVFLPSSRLLDAVLSIPPFMMIISYLICQQFTQNTPKMMIESRHGSGEATLSLFLAFVGLTLIVTPFVDSLLSLPWWCRELSGAWGSILILVGAFTAYATPKMVISRALLVVSQIVLTLIVFMIAISPLLWKQADVDPFAKYVRHVLDKNASIALVGWQGPEITFPARLDQPLEILDASDSTGVVAWAIGHPNGEMAVVSHEQPSDIRIKETFSYLNQYIVLWPAKVVSVQPDVVVLN